METELTLENTIKEFNGIKFILEEDAEKLVKKYNRKNRKKNNNIEYIIHSYTKNKKSLMKVFRDDNGWCSDPLYPVITKNEFENAKKKYNV